MSTIRAVLLGFGNVARAFARNAADVSVVGVVDSTCALRLDRAAELQRLLEHKDAGGTLREYPGTEARLDVAELLGLLPALEVSVVIESLPSNLRDGEPALSWILAAVSQGIAVVTVDKGPLVAGYERLMAAAKQGGTRIGFQGTTGVWPSAAVIHDEIVGIDGVLNGTSNYILSGMCGGGLSIDEALRDAKLRGIAEPDPTLDIDGWDSAAKILILSKAFMKGRGSLSSIERTGIGASSEGMISAARMTGKVVRLMARARRSSDGVLLSVRPEIISPRSPFFALAGTRKAAVFRTARRKRVLVSGVSGREAIARIIMDDVRSVTQS
jgi:homoserine dehydrogenase